MSILLHQTQEHAHEASGAGTELTIILFAGLLLFAAVVVYLFKARTDSA